MKTCEGCGKQLDGDGSYYCGWECHVEAARRDGAVDQRPNGLPVKCITARGLLLECEHGDHPDYQFPVTVDCPCPASVAGEDREYWPYPEEHALIYTDGYVALTLNECTYSIWHLSNGEYLGGGYQDANARLTAESIAEIRRRREGQ